MERATDISAMAQALSPQPLIDSVEYAKFYGERFESVESDCTALLKLELNKSFQGLFYQRFLTGHSGTGKSTELTRLSLDLKERFEFLRLSAQEEMSPFATQPFDLLEVMAVRLVERVAELGLTLDAGLLRRVEKWFESVTETSASKTSGEVGAEAEAGVSLPDLLKSVLRLGVGIKGSAKYSSSRTEEAVRKRLQRISELKDLCNDLFLECNRALYGKSGKEWVFLVEDFDKRSVSEQVLDTVFVQYSNVWTGLRIHLICTIPLWLAFGEKGASLPFQRRILVDIPVFDRDHVPHEQGRRILRGILNKRVDESLFGDGIQEHLIQAAGGNLRDMFSLITEAANFAELAGSKQIERRHADRAVNWLRNVYLQRLGETALEHSIPYETKVEVLVKIYNSGKERVVQDPVLYRLLRARVVHEYNDRYWYGLPPMMVDLLIQQGRLDQESKGGLEPVSR